MRVFLSSDMEGTAGVVDWDQCVGDGSEAVAGRRLLLAEVNAAIEGALAGAGAAAPPPLGAAVLELSVRTTDIAEAASWVRGVERTGPRELRLTGESPLAVYGSFCATIMLTRAVAEAL